MQLNLKFFLKEIGGTSSLSFVVLILSFFFNIYLAKVLLIEEFGQYELSITGATIFYLVINFATDLFTSKLYSKNLTLQNIFNKVVSLKLVLFSLCSILILLLKPNFILPFIAININVFNLGWIYEIEKNNLFYSQIILFEKICFVVLCLIGITYLSKSAEILYVGLLISHAFSIGIQIFRNKKLFIDYKIDFFKRSDFFNLFFLFSVSVFQYINSGISKFFIENKIDIESVALYSMALKILIVGTVFQSQTQKVFRPIFFENSNTLKLLLYFKYSSLPMIIISLIIYLLFPIYVDFLPSEYSSLDMFAFPIALFFLIINLKSLNTIMFTKIDKLSIDFTITSFFAFTKITGLIFLNFNEVIEFIYYFLILEFIEGVIKFIYTNLYEIRLFSKN